jgi:GNAT superfamily N-acetyltransferase
LVQFRSVITVSPAESRDAAAIAALLGDLGRFYGATESEPVDRRIGQINEAIFTSPPTATRSLYLKDLYVPDAYRRQGVGKLLMRAIFETAGTLGCSRVEWTTDAGNTAAQAFYAKLGLPAYPSKIFYRVEDTGSGLGSIVPGRVS